jgi:hypothetical protein
VRKAQYHEYLQSEAWQIRRKWILDLADNRCQICYSTGQLHVHHRTYVRAGREKPSDLIALCAECHARHHDKLPPAPDEAPDWPAVKETAERVRNRLVYSTISPLYFESLWAFAEFTEDDGVLQIFLPPDLPDTAFARYMENLTIFVTLVSYELGFKLPWQFLDDQRKPTGEIMWGSVGIAAIDPERPA